MPVHKLSRLAGPLTQVFADGDGRHHAVRVRPAPGVPVGLAAVADAAVLCACQLVGLGHAGAIGVVDLAPVLVGIWGWRWAGKHTTGVSAMRSGGETGRRPYDLRQLKGTPTRRHVVLPVEVGPHPGGQACPVRLCANKYVYVCKIIRGWSLLAHLPAWLL